MRAWPLTPLLFTLLGISLATIGLTLAINYHPTPSVFPPVASHQKPSPPSQASIDVNNLNAAKESSTTILRSSPFVPDRSAYLRSSASSLTKKKALEYNPQFVGALGHGSALRAMIIWKPGETAQTYSLGEQTPWGTLKSIEKNMIVFQNTSGEKTLELF